jgi:hypothetical protein
MTRQVKKVKDLTISEIIENNKRLINALKNLNDKLCCKDKSELMNSKGITGKQRSVSEPDSV